MALVLDAGGLIAIDRRDRAVGAMLRIAQREAIPLRTSAAVLAQVWRAGSRQVNLARVLVGVDTAVLDGLSGKRIGELLARTRGSDVVDGHLGLMVQEGDIVLTSDPRDINRIIRAQGVRATTRTV
jgi:hypothetical protein